MLEKIILDLNKVDGIIMYSIFQLPENRDYREKILLKIINKKKKIFFACEKISITKENDIKRIENLWLVKKILPSCYKYKKI